MDSIDLAFAGAAEQARMLAAGTVTAPALSTAATDAARVTIAAPHVATVAWILAPGTPVGAGTVVARLDLLGETVEVSSAGAGVVTERYIADGDFVEFETPLLAISPAS